MKVLIDIPDIVYEGIVNVDKARGNWDDSLLGVLCKGVLNGNPISKGHGNLIDTSKIHKAIPAEEDNLTGQGMTPDEMDAYNDGIDAMWNLIQRATPIIKADMDTNN